MDGFFTLGAGINQRVDKWLKADSSAIEDLKNKLINYKKKSTNSIIVRFHDYYCYWIWCNWFTFLF